jgi:disulfide bond formation protein DsbB
MGSAILGGAVAAQQIYIQHMLNPPSCAASLEYLLNTLPVLEVIQTVLQGTTDCAEVTWRLWGFSLAEWSLGAFGILFLGAFYIQVREGGGLASHP